jgi:tRNA threonylcarbamoyladenosine biosynthesis protein TsaE
MDAIFTLPAIDEVAAMFWKKYKHKKIWAFYANMGSGKTTFIHSLCHSILKIKEPANSPTFSIINEYFSPVVGTIYHTDWYRLKDEEDALTTGVVDMLNSGNFCFIEWPENAQNLLPDNTLHIYLETLDQHTRRIFISDNDTE